MSRDPIVIVGASLAGLRAAKAMRRAGEEGGIVVVGDEERHIISFTVEGEPEEERILFSLNTIRHAINLKLEQQELVDQIRQTRDIQMSLLPPHAPAFGEFDLAGRSEPADEVGGDLFDYIPISDRILGVAIAEQVGGADRGVGGGGGALARRHRHAGVEQGDDRQRERGGVRVGHERQPRTPGQADQPHDPRARVQADRPGVAGGDRDRRRVHAPQCAGAHGPTS